MVKQPFYCGEDQKKYYQETKQKADRDKITYTEHLALYAVLHVVIFCCEDLVERVFKQFAVFQLVHCHVPFGISLVIEH